MSGYRHITPNVRKNNAFTALGLVAFVGGVYAWTYYKMKNVSSRKNHSYNKNFKKKNYSDH